MLDRAKEVAQPMPTVADRSRGRNRFHAGVARSRLT